MPDAITQAGRPMTIATPLGTDVLLFVSLAAQESISSLYRYDIDVVAENHREIKFADLLGKPIRVSLELPGGGARFFSGYCSRISQSSRDELFTRYSLEVVPAFWFLTRNVQTRIFQQMNVPDILKKVLENLDVKWEITGTFQPRDYCVQYGESDFAFASRLMEEEGMYYFFTHAESENKLVVANTPQSHPDVAETATILFEPIIGGVRDDDRIYEWVKVQEVRAGKVTLWDQCFELPHRHLEAEKIITDSLQVGRVTHSLKVANNQNLEIFDYPGDYAKRYDGIDKGGGEQASEIQKIFQDNARTAQIRMQEEALQSVLCRAESNCRQITAGHTFQLKGHFDADGKYVVVSTQVIAAQSGYESGADPGFEYSNSFTCIPAALPYRPPRVTPRPRISGCQTAVVVGPAGQEIFTDKYGRVKVQFPWDRTGKMDSNSSCWIRVATPWAGKQWGIVHIPRVGQEVVVDFVEGDPDQPIIVGSVWNAEMMPPYTLPEGKTRSGVKSRTTPSGGALDLNEIRFEDKAGAEQVFTHAARNQDVRVKNDYFEFVGNEKHCIVETDQIVEVRGDGHQLIKGDQNEKVNGSLSLTIGQDVQEKVSMKYALQAGTEVHLKAGTNLVIESGTTLTLKVGGNFINLNAGGVFIKGTMVMINSGGAAGSGSGASPTAPKAPTEAEKPTPTAKTTPPPAAPVQPASYSPMAMMLKQAAASGAPFCDT